MSHATRARSTLSTCSLRASRREPSALALARVRMPSRKPFAESLYSGGIFSMSSTEGHDSTRARALEPGAGWSWTFAHPPTPLSDARHHGTRARHDRSIETRVALARHPRAPSSRASIRATRVVGGEEDAGAVAIEAVEGAAARAWRRARGLNSNDPGRKRCVISLATFSRVDVVESARRRRRKGRDRVEGGKP